MKRIIFGLLLSTTLFSCSNEETKTQNEVASRPTVPVLSPTVQIGTQVWMSKNLNVSRYRNGDIIPQVTSNTQWANLTTGAWCYYNNNPAIEGIYGKFYNWYAVNDPRGLAPTGYHIPSDAKWTTLTTFLGGLDVAGGKMKTTSLWILPNTGATNESGFSGVPAGYRVLNGPFYNSSSYGAVWWSLSEYNIAESWARQLWFEDDDVRRETQNKNSGFSVRCIKD